MMSFKNVLVLFVLSTAVLLTVGCDEGDENGSEYSEEDLTREDGWRQQDRDCNYEEVATVMINNSDTLTITEKDAAIQTALNITAEINSVEDCQKDDTYIFAESGDFEFVAGNNNCQENDDELMNFPANWELEGNTLIINDVEGNTHDAEIKTLTETELVYRIYGKPSGEDFEYSAEGKAYTEVTMVAAN